MEKRANLLYRQRASSTSSAINLENANRLLRWYLPKQSSIENSTQQDIEMIVDKLNNQPMRCLDYLTLNEVFYEHRGALKSSGGIRT